MKLHFSGTFIFSQVIRTKGNYKRIFQVAVTLSNPRKPKQLLQIFPSDTVTRTAAKHGRLH